MAVTVTNKLGGTDLSASSNSQPVCLIVTMDSSYPTGGESLAGLIGPHGAFYGVAQAHPNTVADRSYSWSNALQRLFAIVTSTGAEVADTTNLSADVISLTGFLV